MVVVAARRDMVASFLEPIRRAGLEPVGVDLSAFGMIRALAGGEVQGDDAPPTGRAATVDRPQGAVLYCNLGDVTNLAVARGRACLFTRVSLCGLEAISARLAGARGLAPSTPPSGSPTSAWRAAVEEIEGDPETVAEARRALEEGVAALVDELRLSLDYYGAQEGALPVERIVLCGPGSAIPGLAARMEAARPADLRLSPACARRLRRARRGAADPSLRPRAGGLSDAPRQPDPTRGAPRRARAAAHRPACLRPRSALWSLLLAGVTALVLTGNQIAEREDEIAKLEARRRRRAAKAAAPRRLHPVPQPERTAGGDGQRASPTAASTGSG